MNITSPIRKIDVSWDDQLICLNRKFKQCLLHTTIYVRPLYEDSGEEIIIVDLYGSRNSRSVL